MTGDLAYACREDNAWNNSIKEQDHIVFGAIYQAEIHHVFATNK